MAIPSKIQTELIEANLDNPKFNHTSTAAIPAPAPAPATMSAVGSSGIPVNQIVEKMGAVLGGTTAGAGTDSRWDLPIQERNKETNAESNQPLPVQNFAQPVAPTAWGETPSASPTNNTWGTHPEQPTTTSCPRERAARPKSDTRAAT